MPAKRKKSPAKHLSSRKKVASYSHHKPNWKFYGLLTLGILILGGFIYYKYNFANQRQAEIYVNCPEAKCDKKFNNCKKDCQKKYEKGSERKECIAECRRQQDECESHPCGWEPSTPGYSCGQKCDQCGKTIRECHQVGPNKWAKTECLPCSTSGCGVVDSYYNNSGCQGQGNFDPG